MSTDAVYTTVRAFLEANWDRAAAPMAWENEEFTPPTRLPWIFVVMDDSDYDQMSIGTGSPTTELWRETGGLLFRVSVPAGSGTLVADRLVSDLRYMMLGLQLPNDIRFDSMPTVGRGRGEDGVFYGVWLRCGWIRN